MNNLSDYMSNSIRQIMAKAYKNVLSNPREAEALGWEHTGGCTLFEHRSEVELILNQSKAS